MVRRSQPTRSGDRGEGEALLEVMAEQHTRLPVVHRVSVGRGRRPKVYGTAEGAMDAARARRRATVRSQTSRAVARRTTIGTREVSSYPPTRARFAGETPRPGPGPSGTFSAAVSGT